MTEDELDRYICKVALSGALEFVEKYESKDGEGGSGIIGHFGLGFYSAFMVADEVEVVTKSYTDAPAVRWVCGEDGDYTVYTDGIERGRGTTVILHVNSEGEEFLSEWKLREVLAKYCGFMPVEIYLTDEEKADEPKKDGEEQKEKKPENDIHPLWQKNASDCTEEEYKEFYQKVFSDYREPLFHLHLNADYPLNFKGILFFPKLRENYENLEGKIKLYYNQVFVADNIKEVIPEYLLMLRGVLDCPELPLNVSRSYLQNSAYVTKVSTYIVKKVADKLNSIFKEEREKYEKRWDDLRTFVEYACISDAKFCERMKPAILLSLESGKKVTLAEYLEGAKEKNEGTVYYTTDPELQAQFIEMYRARGIEVAILSGPLDVRFAETLEQGAKDGEKVKFLRVDADLSALGGGEEEENEKLASLFKDAAGEELKLTVKCRKLGEDDAPAVLTVSEESRRMEDMMRMYMPDSPAAPKEATLALNLSSPLIGKLIGESDDKKAKEIASYLLMLAILSNRKFTAEEMKRFQRDSVSLLTDLL
jgi:molecular chaperone HtpG